jgi:Fic family protein
MAKKTTEKINRLLEFIRANPNLSSKEIHEGHHKEFAYATVKRMLQSLVDDNLVQTTGKGKATRYKLSEAYELLHPIELDEYFKKEIDEREIRRHFNHEIFNLLRNIQVFTTEENEHLAKLQQAYEKNIAGLSETEHNKELERLAIDLSWKSSQIEGNTYSLLETERLLKEKETAAGKTRDEATMLLNHKEALDFIIENPQHMRLLSIARIEEIHGLLIKDLNVERNIRIRRVGISGTNYRPLENDFQIREALEQTCALLNSIDNVFTKALLSLMLLSYIQAFTDGNKRTARIVSNAVLISQRYCPLSFRTVDPIVYKKAMLLFYEQNNLTAFKKIFIEQFEFAVNTYF